MTDVNPSQKKIEAGGSNSESRAEIQGVGLFIAVGALAMSTLSVGLWVATMVFAPQIVQSRIDAGNARAYALAELARKEASTAKDIVDLDRAKAKAREELKNERR
jgi:hypothetical protein